MLMSPIRNKIEIQNNKHKKKNKEWNLSILKIFHYRHQNFTSKTAIKDKVFKNATKTQTRMQQDANKKTNNRRRTKHEPRQITKKNNRIG